LRMTSRRDAGCRAENPALLVGQPAAVGHPTSCA
jgi:hypothetical protein